MSRSELARSFPEKSIRQLAHELGISDQSLRNWVKQAEIDRSERVGLTTEEREELRRLRRENRILREEREILKKAAVGSTGERNGLRQFISRGAVGEGLAGSAVELQRDRIEVMLAVC